MTTQTLFGNIDPSGPYHDPGRSDPPHNRTDTSRAAAESIRHESAKCEAIALCIVRNSGRRGVTNEEISERSAQYGRHMTVQCVCGRTNRLAAKGQIVDSGERRPGASGRKAKVWKAV